MSESESSVPIRARYYPKIAIRIKAQSSQQELDDTDASTPAPNFAQEHAIVNVGNQRGDTDQENVDTLISFLDAIARNDVPLYPFSTLKDVTEIEPPRKGAFKETIKMQLPSGRCVAVQFSLDKGHLKDILQDFRHEIMLMCHRPLRQHPNIVDMLGLAVKEEKVMARDCIGFVLEWAPSNLSTFFGQQPRATRLSWETKQNIIDDIAKGISFLHIHGVVHGDLKEDNILVYTGDDGEFTRAKVADFGLSGISSYREGRRAKLPLSVGDLSVRRLGETKLGKERLSPGKFKEQFDHIVKLDVYCFGFLMVYILFDGTTAKQLFHNINGIEPKDDFEEVVTRNSLRDMLSSQFESVFTDHLEHSLIKRFSALLNVILDSRLSSPQQSMEYVFSQMQGETVSGSSR